MEINDSNFEEKVLRNNKRVVLEFWGSWCPPCKMMEPTLKKLKQEQTQIDVFKINSDLNPQKTAEYKILGVPCFLVFEDGKEIKRTVGAKSEQQLLDFINKNE